MRQLEHFPNLVSMFFIRASEKGDAPFLWSKQSGEWRSIESGVATATRRTAKPPPAGRTVADSIDVPRPLLAVMVLIPSGERAVCAVSYALWRRNYSQPR